MKIVGVMTVSHDGRSLNSGKYLPNCSTLIATRNVFLFTETYRREYRCQVCTAGSPRSTITTVNVSVRGRKPRLRALYQCKGLQKPMIYECFIQKLGNLRISESAESQTNSFSIESVFKLQICDVTNRTFVKLTTTFSLLQLQFIYVSRFIPIGNFY